MKWMSLNVMIEWRDMNRWIDWYIGRDYIWIEKINIILGDEYLYLYYRVKIQKGYPNQGEAGGI